MTASEYQAEFDAQLAAGFRPQWAAGAKRQSHSSRSNAGAQFQR
ncbi:hypothetical protein [Rhizobium sp. 1399]